VKGSGQVSGRSQYSLALGKVGRIRGKLLKAIEEIGNLGSEVIPVPAKHDLNLLHRGHSGIKPALLLGFLV
jgi:hypothetical protein